VTAVVVGASAGLGRALAEALAAAGHDLVVVSSDARDLEALGSDLRIRHRVRIVVVPLDLGAELSGLGRLREAATELGGPDALLLPIGWTAAVDDTMLAADVAERLVRTNFRP
jgi:short-subunit dehydrogenase